MKKIYIASPFFNEQEIIAVKQAASLLRMNGHEVFVPMEHKIENGEEMSNFEWGNNVFKMDKNAIAMCDVMMVFNYGLYSDSGTAWECGYAYALNIPVVVYTPNPKESSLMIVNGCYANITGCHEFMGYDFDMLPVYNYEGKQK